MLPCPVVLNYLYSVAKGVVIYGKKGRNYEYYGNVQMQYEVFIITISTKIIRKVTVQKEAQVIQRPQLF